MKKLLSVIVLFLSMNIFAQDTFKPGYYINDQGVKISCLIKDKDWYNTPDRFEYKLTPTSDINIASIETVKEFMVGDNYKLQRFTVNIDKARQDPINLSSQRNPVFEKQKLFLRVLVEGKATLYSHRRNNEEIFFYSVNGIDVEQLVYRVYNLGDNKIRHNSFYKQQLWTDLKCESISLPQINRSDYKDKDLTNTFIKYNDCTNSTYVIYKEEKRGGTFNITVRPGMNFNKLNIYKDSYYLNYTTSNREYVPRATIYEDYDFKPNYRIGLEIEYSIPFFNNKWAVAFEPTYTQFETDAEIFLPDHRNIAPNPISYGAPSESVNLQYSAIEFPLSLRYYIFLNDISRIFINGGAAYNYRFNANTLENFEGGLTRERPDFKFNESDFSLSAFAGFGYNYNNRWSIEGRYYPIKSESKNEAYSMNNNHGLSLIAGFRIF